MNFQDTLLQAIRASAAAYRAGSITPDEMRERAARINALRARSGDLERRKEAMRKDFARQLRALERARAAFAGPDPVVAIDVGYTGDGPMEEVGITSICEERIVTTNYIVAGYEAQRQGIPNLFGETRVLPEYALKALVQTTFDGAGLVVFHAAHCDLKLLGLDTSKTFYADTGNLARLWGEQNWSLDALCFLHGIDNEGWHNSANDSRRTLGVLMKQCYGSRPIVPHFARNEKAALGEAA
jgi:hypothetical protein